MTNFYTKSSLELSELRRLHTLLCKARDKYFKDDWQEIEEARDKIWRKIIERTKSPA